MKLGEKREKKTEWDCWVNRIFFPNGVGMTLLLTVVEIDVRVGNTENFKENVPYKCILKDMWGLNT